MRAKNVTGASIIAVVLIVVIAFASLEYLSPSNTKSLSSQSSSFVESTSSSTISANTSTISTTIYQATVTVTTLPHYDWWQDWWFSGNANLSGEDVSGFVNNYTRISGTGEINLTGETYFIQANNTMLQYSAANSSTMISAEIQFIGYITITHAQTGQVEHFQYYMFYFNIKNSDAGSVLNSFETWAASKGFVVTRGVAGF